MVPTNFSGSNFQYSEIYLWLALFLLSFPVDLSLEQKFPSLWWLVCFTKLFSCLLFLVKALAVWIKSKRGDGGNWNLFSVYLHCFHWRTTSGHPTEFDQDRSGVEGRRISPPPSSMLRLCRWCWWWMGISPFGCEVEAAHWSFLWISCGRSHKMLVSAWPGFSSNSNPWVKCLIHLHLNTD